MNEEVPIGVIEQELLNNPSNSFKISFSTSMPLANLEVLVDDVKKKQFVSGYDECKEFYSKCEKIEDLSIIESPLSQKVFDELI